MIYFVPDCGMFMVFTPALGASGWYFGNPRGSFGSSEPSGGLGMNDGVPSHFAACQESCMREAPSSCTREAPSAEEASAFTPGPKCCHAYSRHLRPRGVFGPTPPLPKRLRDLEMRERLFGKAA